MDECIDRRMDEWMDEGDKWMKGGTKALVRTL